MEIIIVSTSIVFISHVFIPIVIMKDLAQIKNNRLLLLLMMTMMMTKMMMVMKKMMMIKIHMMNILSMVMTMTVGLATEIMITAIIIPTVKMKIISNMEKIYQQ